MDESKDKRSKNFKDSEVDLLLSLVDTKKNILENKKTDSATFKEKEAAWREIEKAFNLTSGIYYRDAKTLKKKYENMKKTSKRRFADEKRYVLGTGGGPTQVSEVTDIDLRIRDIIGTVAVHGNKSSFDSDAGLKGQHEEDFHVLNLPVLLEEDLSCASEAEDLQTTGTGSLPDSNIPLKRVPSNENRSVGQVQLTPKQIPDGSGFDETFSIKKLRTRTSSPISFRKKKSAHPLNNTVAGKKIELLSKSKQELIELQKKSLEQQIRFGELEHEQRMKLLELQIKKEEFVLIEFSSTM